MDGGWQNGWGMGQIPDQDRRHHQLFQDIWIRQKYGLWGEPLVVVIYGYGSGGDSWFHVAGTEQ